VIEKMQGEDCIPPSPMDFSKPTIYFEKKEKVNPRYETKCLIIWLENSKIIMWDLDPLSQ
jgi:hypothetical protein